MTLPHNFQPSPAGIVGVRFPRQGVAVDVYINVAYLIILGMGNGWGGLHYCVYIYIYIWGYQM